MEVLHEVRQGTIYVRRNRLRGPQDTCDGHTHHFPHVMFCRTNHLSVRLGPVGSPCVRLEAGTEHDSLLVAAEVEHAITTDHPDGAMYDCIFARRTPHGEVLDDADDRAAADDFWASSEGLPQTALSC